MSVIYLLVPLALAIVALALWAYVWAAKKGQFDDLKTPGMRVLHEDDHVWTDGPANTDRRPDRHQPTRERGQGAGPDANE